VLVWADEIRYLGVFIVRATKFKCSVDQAKRSFYRAANSLFARVGRLASEEVMVQLLKHKCLPILLYAYMYLCLVCLVSIFCNFEVLCAFCYHCGE